MKTVEEWYQEEYFNISDLDRTYFYRLCKWIQQDAQPTEAELEQIVNKAIEDASLCLTYSDRFNLIKAVQDLFSKRTIQ